MSKRIITKVRRSYSEDLAAVEYQVLRDNGGWEKQVAEDSDPPTPELHAAFDALKKFFVGPFLIDKSFSFKLKPHKVSVDRKASGEAGDPSLFVSMTASQTPDGFNAPVHYTVPKQEANGGLFTAVSNLLAAAEEHIDGARGSKKLPLTPKEVQSKMALDGDESDADEEEPESEEEEGSDDASDGDDDVVGEDLPAEERTTKEGTVVAIGQRWRSCDKRDSNKTLKVVGFVVDNGAPKAIMRRGDDKRTSRVAIERMVPNSKGYALVV